MKKILMFALLLCASISLSAQQMTVASYNIRNANDEDRKAGNGWEQRSPYLCGLIRFQGVDIFGSQEVKDGQLHDMLNLLPGYAHVGVGRDDGKTEGEYSPIFYKKDRFKLLDSGTFWLSEDTTKPNTGWDAALPRICSWGHFHDMVTRHNFWFFNLHLDHIGVVARHESSKLVISKIREMCGAKEPVILTGDFNVDQHDETYTILAESKMLKDSYEVTEQRYVPNGTFNDFDTELQTDSRIDHIFVSPSFTVRNYGVLTEIYHTPIAESHKKIKSGNFPKEVSLQKFKTRVPSDHYPVIVKLDFGNK